MKLTKHELVEYFYANRKVFHKIISHFKLSSDDVIHDCVLKILDSKTEIYDLYNGHLTNYLKRLVRNCCINLVRKEREMVDIEKIELVENEIEYCELYDIISKSSLSEFKKQVIYEHFWKDQTYKQIGKNLNISDGTLKSAFCRSKDELKLLLS